MKTGYPKIALQGTNGLIFVRKNEIMYAIAAGNYTKVFLKENRMVKVFRKLKEVNQLLSDENFIRIHRSHLINLQHAIQFDQSGTERVLLTNGVALPIARHRKASFIERFTRI